MAQVEMWATDEHRVGLKPILHKIWCFDGQRPLAPIEYRYEWRYLVGFVHPASGRTVFHLASTVSILLFEVELAEFARQVGAGPRKQIVLVLNRAGWHTSVRLRVPEHVHLLFLPAYSPELQHGARQPPFRHVRRPRRHPGRTLCRSPRSSRLDPLHNAVPLVATPDQKTTRTSAKLGSVDIYG
jgi:hypothetical protein